MSDPDDVLRLEPEDLNGHTVDELTDYLEAGCEPADPSIDDSPECRIALAALRRLHELAGDAVADGRAPDGGSDWIDAVLEAIPVGARPGRRFPIPVDDPGVTAVITEGAIRGLVRSVGDGVPGLLVGAVRLGSGETPALGIDVVLIHGAALAVAVGAFRGELREALRAHVPFEVGRIDIDVIGLIPPAGTDEER